MTELITYRDHVRAPEIARSQMMHTIMPTRSVQEKETDKIFCMEVIFLLTEVSA